MMAARVAELEEQSEKKATVKVNQAVAIDSPMAKKLDKVLASLEAVQQRLEKLEERKQKETEGNQGKPAANAKPFKGTCYGCGKYGHPKYRCPLNSQQPASGASGLAATESMAQNQQ